MVKQWLFLYNFITAIMWSYILFISAKHMLPLLLGAEWMSLVPEWALPVASFFKHSVPSAAAAEKCMFAKLCTLDIGVVTAYVQSVAVFDLVHAMLGWTPSKPLTVAMQVASRLFIAWHVVIGHSLPTSSSLVFLTMSCAWALSDIIRSLYYLFSLCGCTAPRLLLWARYTFWIVLYPLGAGAELIQAYTVWKSTANYVILGIMLLYVPGFPVLYMHMAKQRGKALKRVASENAILPTRRKKRD